MTFTERVRMRRLLSHLLFIVPLWGLLVAFGTGHSIADESEQKHSQVQLALTALEMGDIEPAIEVTEFEGRTDHSRRTLFIAEFRKAELSYSKLIETVRGSKSPALRSAVLLGLGGIPTANFSEDERTRITDLACQWYELPDSSTHSAAGRLLRRWGVPEPEVADVGRVVPGRNWYINSQGMTLALIVPPPAHPIRLPDPRDAYRKRLADLQEQTGKKELSPEDRWLQAEALYHTGQYEAALVGFEGLLKSGAAGKEEDYELYRLLTLARLKRIKESRQALADWLPKAQEKQELSDLVPYVMIVVPLWVGKKDIAVEQFNQAMSEYYPFPLEKNYNLARAAAQIAETEPPNSPSRESYVDEAFFLLEQCSFLTTEYDSRLPGDVDLMILHDETRFPMMAGISIVPRRPYWIATQEVSRKDFESFVNDHDYQGARPLYWLDRIQVDLDVSPTADHPVQNVIWDEAILYCNWLSEREGLRPVYQSEGNKQIKDRYSDDEYTVNLWRMDKEADGYRLPLEHEWEYSCRAGTSTPWSTGSDESQLAEYCQMVPATEAAVCGSKLPNAWGLHELHGNVSEWCWESLGRDKRGTRGGHICSAPSGCGTKRRGMSSAANRALWTGFRVFRNASESVVLE